MLRAWQLLGLGVLFVVLAPGTVLAQGNDILAPRFDLMIWSIVVFVVLLLVLRKAAWQPMIEGLRKREETIRGSVEEGRRTRDEMEALRAHFKADLDAAYAKIPQMMDDARRDAQRMAEELRAKAMADIQTERQRLRLELDRAHDQALQNLSTHAAQLATLISAKAIGRSLTEDDHRRLIDEALTEMQQRKV
jgi:F-type H+-transporting ATPase subunit b